MAETHGVTNLKGTGCQLLEPRRELMGRKGKRVVVKFYEEEPMKEIRNTLEKEILHWPGVTSRLMMGCLCYFYERKFFAFLMPKNIVITKLPEKERTELAAKGGITEFDMFGKPIRSKTWIKMPLDDRSKTRTILPFVKASYEAAKIVE